MEHKLNYEIWLDQLAARQPREYGEDNDEACHAAAIIQEILALRAEGDSLRAEIDRMRQKDAKREAAGIQSVIERLVNALAQAHLVIEDFLPNIGRCALQNYERLNNVMIENTTLLNALMPEWRK